MVAFFVARFVADFPSAITELLLCYLVFFFNSKCLGLLGRSCDAGDADAETETQSEDGDVKSIESEGE